MPSRALGGPIRGGQVEVHRAGMLTLGGQHPGQPERRLGAIVAVRAPHDVFQQDPGFLLPSDGVHEQARPRKEGLGGPLAAGEGTMQAVVGRQGLPGLVERLAHRGQQK